VANKAEGSVCHFNQHMMTMIILAQPYIFFDLLIGTEKPESTLCGYAKGFIVYNNESRMSGLPTYMRRIQDSAAQDMGRVVVVYKKDPKTLSIVT
jgi:hypothetical protein